MTDLWERQKGERSEGFEYFRIYRNIGPNRTLQKVIDYLSENELQQNTTNCNTCEKIVPIPTLSKLQSLSARWHWVKRSRAWDNYQDQLEIEANNEAYKKSSERLIKLADDITDFLENNVADLPYDEEAKETSKAHAIKSVADAFDKTVKNIRLLYGKSTEIKDEKVDANVGVEADANIHHDLDVAQQIIMNPKYANLTKSILEDIVDNDKE